MFRRNQIAISMANVISTLIKLGAGFLSQGQLTRIARWEYRVTSSDGETIYSSTPVWRLHRQNQLVISIVTSPDEFASKATFKGSGMEHSWAGEDTTKQNGDWIIGDGTFGYDWDIGYSNNGSESDPDVRKEIPNFDASLAQVVLVKTVTVNTYNRSGGTSEEEWELVVYKPTGEQVKMTPLTEYIIKRFNLQTA